MRPPLQIFALIVKSPDAQTYWTMETFATLEQANDYLKSIDAKDYDKNYMEIVHLKEVTWGPDAGSFGRERYFIVGDKWEK